MSVQDTDDDVEGGNRAWRFFYDRLIKPVLTVKDTPHALALGITLGLWVALTPTVGIQMTLVFIIGTVIKANRIAGLAMTWISNPVTFLPMYYAYYVVGLTLTGQEGASYESLKSGVTDMEGWDLVVYFFNELGKPLWLGSLLVATVIAVPVYPVCRKYFEKREKKRAELAEFDSPQSRPKSGAQTS